jgi:3-oxoacyl-[acyl-carrier protein] reductase
MVIETNVVGPYLMAKAAVPEMLKGGFGRIINITKSADSMHTAQSGAYGPSKAALEAEAISWAEELDGTGVTVTCLQPGGAVNTLFGRGAILDRGLPVDVIVNGALWLASDEAGEYNGCRFDAKKWDESLPNDKAGPASRMEPLFPTPERETKLAHAWEKPA